MFYSFSIIFLLSAIISIINHKWLKLPATIGGLILALLVSALLISTQFFSLDFYKQTCTLVEESNFSELILNVMIGFLLFAGAVNIDISKLFKQKKSIITFASVGTILSTVLFGFAFFYFAMLIGLDLPLIVCMLIGSIVSPTDPIAVLSILDNAGIAESLKLKIEGESLFNDGFGVVVFTIILSMVEAHGAEVSIMQEVITIFIHEVLGGLLFGLFLGFITKHLMLMVMDDSKLIIMITLSIVMGGFALAHALGVSGLLATVMLGLYLGHFINSKEFPKELRSKINELWEVLDYSLNMVLFVLIGISLHLVVFNSLLVVAALVAIVTIVVCRYLSVVVSSAIVDIKSVSDHSTIMILTWGALRGGISLALVMSLGGSPYKSTILAIVFVIVVFSIVVQGLTLGGLAKKLAK